MARRSTRSAPTPEARTELVEHIDELFRTVLGPPRGPLPDLRPAHQDLTMGQFRALTVLAQEEPLAVGALAERLGTGGPSASRMVDRLVNDGLVERWDDPDDRRRALVRLTARGRESMAHLHQGRQVFRQRMLKLIARLPDQDMAKLHAGLAAL